MPLYEYQCQECGEVHEMLQRFSDPPYAICPACGGALKKLVSAPAIQFKGSGFYITDYGKGTSGAGAKGSAPASAGESRSAESKTADTKTAESKTSSAKSSESKSSGSGS